MKKSWLSIFSALVITLAALAISPTPVQADRSTKFTATGLAFLTIPPPDIVLKDKGKHLKVLLEHVDAVIMSSPDWPDLGGGYMATVHDSQVTVFPDGSFRGELKGTFTLTTLSGDALQGRMTAHFTGMWPETSSLPASVLDSGSWAFTGGTGSLAGTKGEGKWTANLTLGPLPAPFPPVVTLNGPLTFEGKYRQ